MNLQDLKQKYGIIGNNTQLERAIEVARLVAPTDLNVLINGESGRNTCDAPEEEYNIKRI